MKPIRVVGDEPGSDLRRHDADDTGAAPVQPIWIGPLVIVGCLALWASIMWIAARSVQLDVLDTSTWGRWDTGWYRTIAEEGYSFGRCVGVPNRSIDDYCGAAGWFPGFPYTNRIIGSVTGASVDTVGRWIAFLGLVVTLATLWYGFLARRPLERAVPAMALAAAFPSGVYFGAIFPVSIVTASVVGALALVERRRFLAAGLVGAIGAVSYPSGVMVAAAAVAPLVMTAIGPFRVRLRAALSVALPPVAGYLLVLLNFERTVGRWDAWFKVQEGYGYGVTSPLSTIQRQLASILGVDASPWIGMQTAFVLGVVAVCGFLAVRDRRSLTLGEVGCIAVVGMLWLPPLVLGGDLSLYRAESLLVPAAIVVSRLGWQWIAALAVVAVPISFNMAQLFFANVLI